MISTGGSAPEPLWTAWPTAAAATVGTLLEDEYRRAMATGQTSSFRYFYPPLARWYEIRAYPSSEGLAVSFRDINVERAREERLKDQAELLDLAHDAIVVRDLEHRIAFWNQGCSPSSREAIAMPATSGFFSFSGRSR